uniref:KIB1-4 beta-propeller domain-containing protein n=1 Tax=Oryza brachyantha TaxID=4533 RepID=J3NEM3_ORYBR
MKVSKFYTPKTTEMPYVKCIADDPEQQEVYDMMNHIYSEVVHRYLAELGGRLFMVRRWMRFPVNSRLGDLDETFRFEAFEADLSATPCQWRKVRGFGGRALFLGSECTKFVRASKCVGVQEDCIYFMHRTYDNPSREYSGPCVDPLGDSGVYNMRNGGITPLLPEAMMAKLRLKRQFLTWFFPADV